MQLQLRMNQVAVLYCAAEFVPVDGVFGETTDQAVRLFQEGLGLPVTGRGGRGDLAAHLRTAQPAHPRVLRKLRQVTKGENQHAQSICLRLV